MVELAPTSLASSLKHSLAKPKMLSEEEKKEPIEETKFNSGFQARLDRIKHEFYENKKAYRDNLHQDFSQADKNPKDSALPKHAFLNAES